MAASASRYIDAAAMGFRLVERNNIEATSRLGDCLRSHNEVSIFKTHDVAAKDFDRLSLEIPELKIITINRDFRDVVVSRYFYSRYYWRTVPALGSRPQYIEDFISALGAMPDREALALLLTSNCLREWVEEWAAFETPFTTKEALRVTYKGLLDESDFPELVRFTNLSIKVGEAFKDAQRQETAQTGRVGMARFNRSGRSGEWRDWFDDAQSAELQAMASKACRTLSQYAAREERSRAD